MGCSASIHPYWKTNVPCCDCPGPTLRTKVPDVVVKNSNSSVTVPRIGSTNTTTAVFAPVETEVKVPELWVPPGSKVLKSPEVLPVVPVNSTRNVPLLGSGAVPLVIVWLIVTPTNESGAFVLFV